MSYFRSYFEKNNTIIKGAKTNTAKNPTTEIFYGSSFSRFIFKVDFTELINKIINKELILNPETTHTLHLTNTIFGDETFLGAERGTGKQRTSSFNLILFKVPQDWDEGVGFDYENVDFIAGDKTYNNCASNWYFRQTGVEWTIPGIYTNIDGTTPPEILGTIHFDNGNEDINLDVTDYVNTIIYGLPDYGLGLAFTYDLEQSNPSVDQSIAFFSKYTQTFFEPYVETFFNDTVKDDRYNAVTDIPQSFYLYVYNNGNLINLDQNPIVDILDRSKNIIGGLNDLPTTNVRKGIYKVTIDGFDGTLCPVKSFFFDKWKGLMINGKSIDDVTQKFVLNPLNSLYSIGENITETKKYVIQVSGIKQNEKLIRGENKKVVVTFRTIGSNLNFSFDEVYYRMYIKEGHTNVIVHDWTLLDKSNENSYYLNTGIYIPREYYVEFKATINSEDIFYKEPIKFEIISEK